MARSRSSRRGAVSPVESLPPTCAAMISSVVGAGAAGGQGGVDRHRSAFLRCGWSRARSRGPLAGAPEARGCKPDAVPDGPSGRAAGCRGPAEVGLSGTREILPGSGAPVAQRQPLRRGSGPAAATAGGGRRRPPAPVRGGGSRSSRTGCPRGPTTRRRPLAPRASPTAARAGRPSAPAPRRPARACAPNRTSTTSPSCSVGDIDGPRTATRRQRTCDLPARVFGLRAVGYVGSVG